MRRGTLHGVHETQDMCGRETAEPARKRVASGSRIGQCGHQPVQRPVLAEEEQLFFAPEVMVQVGRREVGRDRDFAHARGGEPALPEDPGRRTQDLEAAAIGPAAHSRRPGGAVRTAVRKMNHGSIVKAAGTSRQAAAYNG